MFTRRTVVTSLLCAPALRLVTTSAKADDLLGEPLIARAPQFIGIPSGLAPGDKGYCHEKYHPCYQELFAKQGHCSCGDGDCRVTMWRVNPKSPKGYDLIVNRAWIAIPESTWMPPEDSSMVPPQLLQELAHVCAYQTGGGYGVPTGISIPCALVNRPPT